MGAAIRLVLVIIVTFVARLFGSDADQEREGDER
jgi:hypothetical protein